MAPIKLTYFPISGLAEPIRYLLAYGKLEFEDERIYPKEFNARKPNLPYGKLPVLEIEGHTLNQSVAICRFLAQRVGLVGDTEMEATQIDIQVDNIGDLRAALAGFNYEKNKQIKAKKRKEAMENDVPFILSRLENQVLNNGGYFVNGKLTWADLYFSGLTEYLTSMGGKGLFATSPNLQALNKRVLALPQLQSYLASRPSYIRVVLLYIYQLVFK